MYFLIGNHLLLGSLGVLGPCVVLFALGLGAGAAAACAGLAALILAAAHLSRLALPGAERQPLAGLAAAAGVALSALVLLPRVGLRASAAAGVALACAGWSLRRLGPAADATGAPENSRPAWVLALAAASAMAWARCLAQLWGHSFYALCGLMVSAGVGTAVGSWLGRRLDNELKACAIPDGLWVFASGLAGVIGLEWLRFIGLNSGSAEHLVAPLLGARDIAFIAGQSGLAAAVWISLLCLGYPRPESSPPSRRRWLIPAAVLAALGLAAWLMARFGAAPTAALFHAAACAAGIAAAGPRRLLESPVLSRAVAAGFALALLLAWRAASLMPDIWTNRLNAAWAGGRFLALSDDGRETLGAYRFAAGDTLLLRDATAWANDEPSARREAHLPLLAHGSPGRVLLAGVRNPATVDAALAHQVKIEVLDPHPGAKLILSALAKKAWPPAAAVADGSLRFARGNWRNYLRAGGKPYDVVIVELPVPWSSPEAAFMSTTGAFRDIKRRLSKGGVAAVRLPAPYPPRRLARLIQSARQVFAHVGGYDLPGGYLLLAADNQFDAGPFELLGRRNDLVKNDDMSLPQDIFDLRWQSHESDPGPALLPDTDDRPLSAFPLLEPTPFNGLARTAAEAASAQ